MSKLLSIFLMLCSSGALAHADSCFNKGDTCKTTIAGLHPTQFNIGQREVDQRAAKFSDMSDKKLQKYIDQNPAPVAIGPGGEFYMTDHHHLARALRQRRGP